MKIARFDPAPCGFPKPRIPPLPHRIQLRPCGCWQAVFSQRKRKGQFRSFSRGRYALAEAYRLAGLKRDTTLLAPAYHCLMMLDPAINMWDVASPFVRDWIRDELGPEAAIAATSSSLAYSM